MVSFSSIASLLGSGGQSNYGAANSQLDALATFASQQGLPATSVQYGAWQGAGMGSVAAAKLDAMGLGAVQANELRN